MICYFYTLSVFIEDCPVITVLMLCRLSPQRQRLYETVGREETVWQGQEVLCHISTSDLDDAHHTHTQSEHTHTPCVALRGCARITSTTRELSVFCLTERGNARQAFFLNLKRMKSTYVP